MHKAIGSRKDFSRPEDDALLAEYHTCVKDLFTHEMVQKGEPLTWKVLNKVYRDLNCLYFGDDIVIDTQIDIEWARIPHFYNSFYLLNLLSLYSILCVPIRNRI